MARELANLSVWTVGHSTRSWEEFLALLQAHRIEVVADVRRFPGSRKFPHFGGDALAQALPRAGIEYLPLPELGGRRKPLPDSPHTAWRNAAFRAYADHMDTDVYRAGRQKLIEAAARLRTTLLCSEAVWWRCHRGLIADDLKAAGADVRHIMSPAKSVEHPYTGAATLADGQLNYRSPPADT